MSVYHKFYSHSLGKKFLSLDKASGFQRGHFFPTNSGEMRKSGWGKYSSGIFYFRLNQSEKFHLVKCTRQRSINLKRFAYLFHWGIHRITTPTTLHLQPTYLMFRPAYKCRWVLIFMVWV